MIADANDELIFKSKLNLFIDYKWDKQYTYVALYQSIYIVYIIIHCLWIVNYNQNVIILTILIVFNTAMLLEEAL